MLTCIFLNFSFFNFNFAAGALAKNSKKNMKDGRKIFRTNFLKQKLGIELPKLFKMKGGMHCDGSTKKTKGKKTKGKKTKGKK